MQTKIVKILYTATDYVSGQEISNRLGVSRQAVNKAVKVLRDKGFVISSVTNKGYLLESFPEQLCEEAVKCLLDTKLIGSKIIVLDSVTSTNDYLKKLNDLRQTYEKKYGPLTTDDSMQNKWRWIKSPWPWENEEEID